MSELIAAVAAVVTTMGLGGAVGAFIQSRLEARRRISEKEHGVKERRYLCIPSCAVIAPSPTQPLGSRKSARRRAFPGARFGRIRAGGRVTSRSAGFLFPVGAAGEWEGILTFSNSVSRG